MNINRVFKLFAFVIASFAMNNIYAQETVVKGIVVDSITQRPLQGVSVYFLKGRGVVTDSLGRYMIITNTSINKVVVSSVGFRQVQFTVNRFKMQELNIELGPDPALLTNVTVNTNKRAKYRNKDNPAVELIRNVIENRENNRIASYDYVEYEQYEKIQAALSNSNDKVTNTRLLKKYNFLFENRDSSKLNGKVLMPIYLEERLSKQYMRKNPSATKSMILGEKKVNFGSYIDNEGLSSLLNRLYENIDIYENNIPIFAYQFLSPIANTAPTFYMYYIRDTITDEYGTKLVKLYFTPRNTNDLLFRGNMFITLDGNYAVQKINMFISRNANINWIKELHADLEFERGEDKRYHLVKSDLMADMGLSKNSTSGGFFGERTVSYKGFSFNKTRPDSLFQGPAVVRNEEVIAKMPDSFWQAKRHNPLSGPESKVYSNIDSLERMPSFRRTMALITLLFAGYGNLGPVEIGPVNTFYSFNPVEGFRLRFGGRTTPAMSKRLYFETYGAYGFNDKQWKGFLSATYSLNNKSIYTFPMNYIRISAQSDTKIPGQDLEFVQEDNFLLSFKRGNNERWLYNNIYQAEFVKEFKSRFSYSIGFKNWHQQPAGILTYTKTTNGAPENVQNVITTELNAQVRWAPNEKFYQGKIYRIPIFTKYPIFTLSAAAGIKGFLGGQYNYQKVDLRIEKRNYMGRLGYADATLEGGYTFGQVPFPLLTVHRANQTFAYQLNSYNMMNFLEFVSDRYASFTWVQHFMGIVFNRIPLLKKLKFREVASFKILYGGVRNENNPVLNPSLFAYPTINGVTSTFALDPAKPYIETSVGVENIFNILRVDFVKRLSYLDNPGISPYGIRTRFRFDF
ncbi:MAG: hypothetical protein CUR34_02885 [Sediminibacterium sp.]|nr:MAG: hypothetical protein CUR34_02885 [Sediminibacterium sp.] [Sediminibacterium sp. FEMGT703S]